MSPQSTKGSFLQQVFIDGTLRRLLHHEVNHGWMHRRTEGVPALLGGGENLRSGAELEEVTHSGI